MAQKIEQNFKCKIGGGQSTPERSSAMKRQPIEEQLLVPSSTPDG